MNLFFPFCSDFSSILIFYVIDKPKFFLRSACSIASKVVPHNYLNSLLIAQQRNQVELSTACEIVHFTIVWLGWFTAYSLQ